MTTFIWERTHPRTLEWSAWERECVLHGNSEFVGQIVAIEDRRDIDPKELFGQQEGSPRECLVLMRRMEFPDDDMDGPNPEHCKLVPETA